MHELDAMGLTEVRLVGPDCAGGREIQSSAFLSPPGIDQLYSGEQIRSASADATAARNAATAGGAGSTSRSGLKCGSAPRPS